MCTPSRWSLRPSSSSSAPAQQRRHSLSMCARHTSGRFNVDVTMVTYLLQWHSTLLFPWVITVIVIVHQVIESSCLSFTSSSVYGRQVTNGIMCMYQIIYTSPFSPNLTLHKLYKLYISLCKNEKIFRIWFGGHFFSYSYLIRKRYYSNTPNSNSFWICSKLAICWFAFWFYFS